MRRFITGKAIAGLVSSAAIAATMAVLAPAGTAAGWIAAAALLPALFAVEDTHWWAAGMRHVSHALLNCIALPSGGIVLTPRPDAVAMQVEQTVRATPLLTVISPLQLPPTTGVPTATRRPTWSD